VVDCIRNGFVKVLIVPGSHKQILLKLGVETRNDYIERLKKELITKYGADQKLISKQDDFAVLNYVGMSKSKGSSASVMAAVKKVMGQEDFRHMFIPLHTLGSLDEDEVCNEGLDLDYIDPSPVDGEQPLQYEDDNAPEYLEETIEEFLDAAGDPGIVFQDSELAARFKDTITSIQMFVEYTNLMSD
ncbi:hypothetical protein BGZ50_009875, partial [Haplosporangium sp. Z 11]